MAQVRIPQAVGERKGENRFVKVESASRPGHFHSVDMDREFCSCESRVICWHIRSQWCPHCEGMGTEDTRKTYPRVIPCSHCEGTGRLPS